MSVERITRKNGETVYDVLWSEVADAALEEHGRRRRNPGRADWQVRRLGS